MCSVSVRIPQHRYETHTAALTSSDWAKGQCEQRRRSLVKLPLLISIFYGRLTFEFCITTCEVTDPSCYKVCVLVSCCVVTMLMENRLLFWALLSATVILSQMGTIWIIAPKPLSDLSLSDRCESVQKQQPDHWQPSCVYTERESMTRYINFTPSLSKSFKMQWPIMKTFANTSYPQKHSFLLLCQSD